MIAAFAIPVLLGFAGLALEYGQLLLVRAEAQRTADLAAHAGATAYNRTGSAGAMVDAAKGVAGLNGFGADEIVVALDTSFPTASGTAVRATITVPRRLFLPQLVGGDTSVDVMATAVAGAVGGQPACIQALDPNGSGIRLSGSAALQANACAVTSNAAVAVPCGTSIITGSLSYDGGPDPHSTGCNSIRTPDGEATSIVRRATPDPLAGYEAILLASARMAATATLSPPGAGSMPSGPDIEFGWDKGATMARAASVGCSAAFTDTGYIWTFLCPGLSTVNLGRVTIAGGLTLRFNPGASADVTYNLAGGIRNNGANMTFAGGIFNVAQGLVAAGGSVTEFGAGSYRIGPASNGDAISGGGSSQIYMGSAMGGVFEVTGRIATEGNSCLSLPAAALHEINGSIDLMGAVRFGAGVYAINGFMHLGGRGGGSVYCRGETISVDAVDTTFLISAAGVAPAGWACIGKAFCVTAGYSNARITAPLTGPFADMAVIGPLNPSRNAGATFTSGASGARVSGAFYVPNGPISVSGGASAGSTSGGCFQLIGAEISLSGGTSVASECRLPGTGSVGQVVILR